MRILHEPLNAITAADIGHCADQVAEGAEFELKRDLPTKHGQPDAWHNGGQVGEHARNAIAQEIVAFANTFGGVVLVGIEETADHPKRAERPSPLPRVHDLARRLRQAVFEKIDPPLPLLEAEGIVLGGDEGVVVLRVPSSRRKPHRHTANNEVFVRRADESVRIGMREIQDLTIRAASEVGRVEEIIEERRNTFSQRFGHWTNSHYRRSDDVVRHPIEALIKETKRAIAGSGSTPWLSLITAQGEYAVRRRCLEAMSQRFSRPH